MVFIGQAGKGMGNEVGYLDIIAMLGLFVAGFVMWVAWELITGRRLLAPFLAIGSFTVTWLLVDAVGVHRPWPLLLIEGAAAFVLVRVANGSKHQAGE